MGQLRKGTAVTIVHESACVLTRVADVAGTERFVTQLDDEVVGAEGVVWIRGWHTPRSKPVLAALSAQALALTPVQKPATKKPLLGPKALENILGNALGSFMANILTKGSK